ncbi:hypothetical protein [Roseateles sp.]|jgi:hypothetical protein|uniref:hypothetical protein n=1 Tax=Roseateles sp. TaxID=1971397 RepID=UPI0037CB78B5
MLRTLVALLLLANALFFAWTQGWLDPVIGTHGHSGREPHRMQLEQQRERLSILSPQAVTALQQPVCLEFGPFGSDEALRGAKAALERLNLTPAAWQVDSSEQPAVWAVATAKLDSREQLSRREEALKRLKIDYEPLTGKPDEQPSLLLSRHASEAAARAALEARRPLRDLRVLQLQPPQPRHLLRLASANGLLARQITDSRDASKALGTAKTCIAPAASAANGAATAVPAASAASR